MSVAVTLSQRKMNYLAARWRVMQRNKDKNSPSKCVKIALEKEEEKINGKSEAHFPRQYVMKNELDEKVNKLETEYANAGERLNQLDEKLQTLTGQEFLPADSFNVVMKTVADDICKLRTQTISMMEVMMKEIDKVKSIELLMSSVTSSMRDLSAEMKKMKTAHSEVENMALEKVDKTNLLATMETEIRTKLDEFFVPVMKAVVKKRTDEHEQATKQRLDKVMAQERSSKEFLTHRILLIEKKLDSMLGDWKLEQRLDELESPRKKHRFG